VSEDVLSDVIGLDYFKEELRGPMLGRRVNFSRFSTSQDDLGKTKRSLGLGAAYLVSS
jgi:hypothetical protein